MQRRPRSERTVAASVESRTIVSIVQHHTGVQGAMPGLLKIRYCSGALVAQLCSSGVGVRSRRV